MHARGAILALLIASACGRHPRDGEAALPAATDAGEPCVTVDLPIYANTARELYRIDPEGWKVTRIGAFDTADRITDLAVARDGTLYGLSFTALYRVDKLTAKVTWLATPGGDQNNALTALPDGTLLVSDDSGQLARVNPTTGAVTPAGKLDQGLRTSGDLVTLADGTVLGIGSTDPSSESERELLFRLDPATAHAEIIGPVGFGPIWSLAYANGRAIGLTSSGQVIQIDPHTGHGAVLAKRDLEFWGAAVSPNIPASSCAGVAIRAARNP
jgi:outer membrane protein assembly factor BamB